MRDLTVLKFGWEFPPNHFGGLGVASEGLIYGLTSSGVRVILVLPQKTDRKIKNCKIISPSFNSKLLSIIPINSLIREYLSSQDYTQLQADNQNRKKWIYSKNIFEEVTRFTNACIKIIRSHSFDIIHAHDWMTFQVGILAKKITGKPLIIHIHATEFDRTGDNGANQEIFNIEKSGMKEADKIIAVSEFTKQKIIKYYNIDSEKINVVHNAISFDKSATKISSLPLTKRKNPIILFLGRLTLQKGPDYFLTLARMILQYRNDIDFVITGSGDMEQALIKQAAEIGIGDKVFFTGFLRGEEVKQIYNLANVYIMPSVSEPFGITPLEAMKYGIPAIISKSSGVSEVINHCFKSDFWDINKMAEQIIAILEYPPLAKELSTNGRREVEKFSWISAAQKCINLYKTLTSKFS